MVIILALMYISCSGEQQYLGEKPGMELQIMELEQALQPSNYERLIRVKSTVYSVCQDEGCWLVMSQGDKRLRVRFKNGMITAPKDCAGKQIEAEGIIHDELIPPDEAGIYAVQSGKPLDTLNIPPGGRRIPVFEVQTLYTKGLLHE
jgi:hypothetical protein